jgi:hypothetical protein
MSRCYEIPAAVAVFDRVEVDSDQLHVLCRRAVVGRAGASDPAITGVARKNLRVPNFAVGRAVAGILLAGGVAFALVFWVTVWGIVMLSGVRPG